MSIMKIAISLLLVLFFASPVLAQEITTPDSSVEVRINNRINTNKAVRQEIKTEVSSKNEELRNRITAVKRERIRSFYGRMIVRIEVTIERLEKIIDRLKTRIASIKENEVNLSTTEAENTIDQAYQALLKAKTELATLSAQLEELLASEEPKLTFGKIQDSLKVIKSHLVDTHRLLVQAIGEIKGLRVGDNNNED